MSGTRSRFKHVRRCVGEDKSGGSDIGHHVNAARRNVPSHFPVIVPCCTFRHICMHRVPLGVQLVVR